MTAALRLGACYRTLGDAERAGTAYAAAMAVAHERGDARTVLRARLGEAKLIQERGNLPLADARMADVIRDASSSQLQDIRAWAFHDRSAVALSARTVSCGRRMGIRVVGAGTGPARARARTSRPRERAVRRRIFRSGAIGRPLARLRRCTSLISDGWSRSISLRSRRSSAIRRSSIDWCNRCGRSCSPRFCWPTITTTWDRVRLYSGALSERGRNSSARSD